MSAEDLTVAEIDALPVGQNIFDNVGQRWTKEAPGKWRDHTYPPEYPAWEMDSDNRQLYYRYRAFSLEPKGHSA